MATKERKKRNANKPQHRNNHRNLNHSTIIQMKPHDNSMELNEAKLYAEGENTTAASSFEDQGDDSSVTEYDSDEYDSDYEGEEESFKQRVSYSKDMLKPTRQGSLIHAGIDHHKENSSPSVNKQQHHAPDYTRKQLRPTRYGANLKQGADVPRDHVILPEDPNAKLAQVYQQQSHKFRSTGYGEQLKQGQEVPRDHVPQPVDPNAKLGEVYKSVPLKKAPCSGGGLQKKKPATGTTILPPVKLKRTKLPNNDNKNNHTKTKLPSVSLQKTAPLSKKDPATFKQILPQEFLEAQQKLKRRTERPWYSQGISASQPVREWFFQRGEWNSNRATNHGAAEQESRSWFFGGKNQAPEPARLKPTTTFFRGSNSSVTTSTTRSNPNQYHVANYYAPNSKSKFKPVNSTKSEEQRRRRGLPPPKASRTTKRAMVGLKLLLVLLAFLGSLGFTVQRQYPAEVQTVLRLIQQTVTSREKYPTVVITLWDDHAHPWTQQTVDRACKWMEEPFTTSPINDTSNNTHYYKDWVLKKVRHGYEHVQATTIAACLVARSALGVAVSDTTENRTTLPSDAILIEEAVATVEPHGSQRLKNTEECYCPGIPKPNWKKWIRRLFQRNKMQQIQQIKCCNRI